MLYRGTKPGAFYRGAYKPGKLYKGTQLVAGYEDVFKAAPASWDGTYDDVMGVAAQGKGKQQTYSGAQLLDISQVLEASNAEVVGDAIHITDPTASGNNRILFSRQIAPGTYTISLDATLPDSARIILRPFDAAGAVKNDAAVTVQTDGYQAVWIAAYEAFCLLKTGVAAHQDVTFTVSDATYFCCGFSAYVRAAYDGIDIIDPMLVAGSTATAYEPYVGGQPSPSPDYPQPLVAAEGSLTASGRTGTTPTTVTLPVLRAIPGSDIRDTLAYIGGQWQVTRRVGVIDSYAGESMDGTWASSTGQLTTGAVVWYALATPTTETVTLGELPSYPVHTELAVAGDYPPDVTGTVKVGN